MESKMEYLIDNVKVYNEKLAFEIMSEMRRIEKQYEHEKQVLLRKISDIEGFKNNTEYKYVIWDNETNGWLSPNQYSINQNGEVARHKDTKALVGQEDFEIYFIADMDKDNFDELIGYSGIGKMLENLMQKFDVMAFGKNNEQKLFNKITWIKKYHKLRDFMLDNFGKETSE